MSKAIKLIAILFITCVDLHAQDRIPNVVLRSHPLMDVYIFASSNIGLPSTLYSMTTDRSYVLHAGAFTGLGLGFHMPNDMKWAYSFRCGYHYNNDFYVGSKYPGGLSTHWLNLDVRIMYAIALFGIESDVLLGGFNERQVPLDFLGMSLDCFNPATLGIYGGFCVPLTDNLYLDWKAKCILLQAVNNKKVGQRMFKNSGEMQWNLWQFDIGLTYRIFTTGKKSNNIKIYFRRRK